MEYNASATKHLFWFVETRETARLLGNHSMDEVRQIVIEENLYQQKSDSRLINEFGCIRKRLETLPEELQRMMVTADINTGKLIAFVGCMAADKLLFIEAQKRLTLEENIVISVGLFGHSGDEEVWDGMDEGTLSKTKEMLDDMHKRKIDMADSIFVINVGGYIGESTKSEIEYAREHGKMISYLEPVS